MVGSEATHHGDGMQTKVGLLGCVDLVEHGHQLHLACSARQSVLARQAASFLEPWELHTLRPKLFQPFLQDLKGAHSPKVVDLGPGMVPPRPHCNTNKSISGSASCWSARTGYKPKNISINLQGS